MRAKELEIAELRETVRLLRIQLQQSLKINAELCKRLRIRSTDYDPEAD